MQALTVYHDEVRVGDASSSYNEVAPPGSPLLSDTNLLFNPDSGLIGHWKFDEWSETTVTDSSGNGNIGTLVNGPTWTTGKIGGALDFDGVDDYVDAGSAASLDNVRPITISAWIYPRSHGEGNAGRIISKQDAMGRWTLHFNTTGRLLFHKDFSGSSELNRATAGGTIAFNKWQHVVVTWDGSSNAANVHIYRNGGETGYSTSSNGIDPPKDDDSATVRIGSRSGGQNVFDGLIDQVRIYNRVLSIADIQALYTLESESSDSIPPSTLVGDLNNDGTVNAADWSLMASVWFTNDATADLNKDGIVNSIDFSLMNANWGSVL